MPSLSLSDQIFNQWVPGIDTAVLGVGSQEPNSTVTRCLIDGNGAEWGLKMPNNVGSTFNACMIRGGKERALDIVRGGNIIFNTCQFATGKDRSPTKSRWSLAKTCDIGIKGGAHDIAFNQCIMTDLLLGDHCIYDNAFRGFVGPKTSGITLTDCVHPAGKNTPIILRVFNADLPKLVNTKAIAHVYCGLSVKVYFWVAGKWIDSRLPAKENPPAV